jgi:hypothetical protein
MLPATSLGRRHAARRHASTFQLSFESLFQQVENRLERFNLLEAGHLQELHFGGLIVGCRASSRGPLDRRSFAVGFCLLVRRCRPPFFGALYALTVDEAGGRAGLSAPQQAQTELAYYGCHGYYGWVPDGTIAGTTGGYPYFGWYGYPLVPYRYCGGPYHRHYGLYRRRLYRHYGSW